VFQNWFFKTCNFIGKIVAVKDWTLKLEALVFHSAAVGLCFATDVNLETANSIILENLN
jgi:hypothetical protein